MPGFEVTLSQTLSLLAPGPALLAEACAPNLDIDVRCTLIQHWHDKIARQREQRHYQSKWGRQTRLEYRH